MPFIPPKSLQYTPEEISPLIKARTHLQKAEDVKEPHFRYLELWKGFEALYREQTKGQGKLLQNRAGGRAAGELDLIGGQLTAMTRPRVEQLLRHEDIPSLNAAIARKNLKRLLGENEMLVDNGMTEAAWALARKDLTFNLKNNYWKAAEGLARLLFIVRGACDPKVKKTDNVVSDVETLGFAYNILRFALRSLIEQLGEDNETFLGVGGRMQQAQKSQQAMQKGKKA